MLVRDLATALDGHGGISGITLNDDYTLTFTMADETTVTTTSVRGATGAKGDKGTDGRAITSVTKTDTSGLVDTYKIQFSDNTSTTFTVTNGASIKSVAKTGTSGLVDTYTVTLTDNTTSTFTVTNGNGIASIALQSGTHAAGTTDVYKITFDNGQYTTFSVYNGLNGSGSVATVNDKLPDASGNVSLAATDVGAPTVEEFNTLETTVGGKQPTTNSLGTETDLADGDFIPFYDTSASANKKTLWSNIVAKIRTALFGSANGFLKADGSGNISAEGSIKTADLANGSVTAPKIADGAVSQTFTATITAAGWAGDAAPYTNEVTVTGLTAHDNPFIDMIASSAFETAETEIEAFANIYRMVTAENKLTVYAAEKPTVDIAIQIKVVRK